MPKLIKKEDLDFTHAPLFKKTTILNKEQVKIAKGGEEITTIRVGQDGKEFIETKNTAKKGDYIVGETEKGKYIIEASRFPLLYEIDPENENQYLSLNTGKAILVEEDVNLITSWGKEIIQKGGIIFKSDQTQDIYGNQASSFNKDFSRLGKNNRLIALSTSLKEQQEWAEKFKEEEHLEDIKLRIRLLSFLKKGEGKHAWDHQTKKEPPHQKGTQSPKAWEVEVGSKYERNFELLNISNQAVVVEVGPGSVSKIGIGLANYGKKKNPEKGFCGSVYIIEPEEAALNQLMDNYKSLMPNANIKGFPQTLRQALDDKNLKKLTIDLVVGNHALDDFISGKYLFEKMGEDERNRFFKNHYGDNADAKMTASIWEKISKDHLARKTIIDETTNEWVEIISQSKAVVLSCYDSYFFRSNEAEYSSIGHADPTARRILKAIEQQLIQRKLVKEGEFILSPSTEISNKDKQENAIQTGRYWISTKLKHHRE